MKRAIRSIVRSDRAWPLLDRTLLRLARYANLQRTIARREPVLNRAIAAISPDLSVRYGVFRGMKYPGRQSVVSPFFPKLVGCYERELEPLLDRICATNYSEVVDIGCAEGYYAVGLALRLRQAAVYAYDTDPRARDLCGQMRTLNGVTDRVTIGTFCSPQVLMQLPLTRKALILSDCEGYERELFTPETVRFLRHHDVLIEVHDYVDPAISSYLRQVFDATHQLTVIQSIDDTRKIQQYVVPGLEHLDASSKRILLGEYRTGTQEWFFLTPGS